MGNQMVKDKRFSQMEKMDEVDPKSRTVILMS
jgi:hypothetical protein